MLKFYVLDKGKPAKSWPVRNGYLIGADRSAMRGFITFRDGQILCKKHELGPAAFAIQQNVGQCGELTIQTTLLPDRDEPYLLSLEQARHRVMTLYNKLEDWGMLDRNTDAQLRRHVQEAQRYFVEALCHQKSDVAMADELAKRSLAIAIKGSEELALAHASMLLSRRKHAGVLPRYPVGCGISLDQTHDQIRAVILANFDFLLLPAPWRDLAVTEGEYNWEVLDNWVDWAARSRTPLMGGPLVSFESSALPDWAYIWEHDYEAIRDQLYEHVEQVVNRYQSNIRAWNVVAGLHTNSQFDFTFDQLMDLTRMATSLVKNRQPTAKVLVEIRQPFGEYYSKNPRSIPPLMYADLLVQGGIQFDGLILRIMMGQAVSGQYTRDLMQLSSLLDQFAVFGKPVHVILGSPSDTVSEWMIAMPESNSGDVVDPHCGYWHRPWSQRTQSNFLGTAFCIALSKPFVDTISWTEVIDHPNVELPLSGLVTEEHQPKEAFTSLIEFRDALADKDPNSFAKIGAFDGGPDRWAPFTKTNKEEEV